MEKKRKPRGWWNTSFHDKARAKYQADVLAETLAEQQPATAAAEQLTEAYRRGWADGRAALLAEQAQRHA